MKKLVLSPQAKTLTLSLSLIGFAGMLATWCAAFVPVIWYSPSIGDGTMELNFPFWVFPVLTFGTIVFLGLVLLYIKEGGPHSKAYIVFSWTSLIWSIFHLLYIIVFFLPSTVSEPIYNAAETYALSYGFFLYPIFAIVAIIYGLRLIRQK